MRRRARRIAATTVLLAISAAAHSTSLEVLGEHAAADGAPRSWKLGERIPVACLNRTADTGEHITDAQGELQYIPFPECNETGRPLELTFGSETDIRCTIAALSDPLFHLLEFYIHNDAPLSCRLPSLPPAAAAAAAAPGSTGATTYTHLQIALSGTLQLSHLHINPQLNVIVHTTASAPADDAAAQLTARARSKKKTKTKNPPLPDALIPEGALLAATAYSLPPSSADDASPRIVIGDPLPLVLTVRWFSERTLPPSTARLPGHPPGGLGGHVHVSTVLYCLLSFFGGVALSLAYWRGVELPRRLRYYGAEKLGMGYDSVRGGHGYAFPGKRD